MTPCRSMNMAEKRYRCRSISVIHYQYRLHYVFGLPFYRRACPLLPPKQRTSGNAQAEGNKWQNLPVKNSSKLNMMYPSLSLSYPLNTSVNFLSEIQLCTNKSKLILPLPLLLSYVLNKKLTKDGVRWYPNSVRALENSSREI